MASSELGGAETLLARIASPVPAPGAGAAAALAAGLAAALVEKACAVALRHEDHPRLLSLRDAASGEREAALRLADEDAEAYRRVVEAQRAPDDDPARAERVAVALSAASEAPLAIAAGAAGVAEACAEAAALVAAPLRGEAVTGALLAEAAARAAAGLVSINLQGRDDDGRVVRARELARRATTARERAEGELP